MLILGITANILYWPLHFIDFLSRHYQVIIFDNRGAGKSDMPEEPYTMEQFVDDIIGLLDHLRVKQTHIYGISMGGMIAQHLVLKYPERCKTLILAATNPGIRGIRPSDEAVQFLREFRSGDPLEDAWKFIRMVYTPEFIERKYDQIKHLIENPPDYPLQQPYAYRNQLDATRSHDTLGRLHEIKIPTLIVVGMRDKLIPPENALLLYEKIPNSRLIQYDQGAHVLEREVRSLATDIHEFLQSV